MERKRRRRKMQSKNIARFRVPEKPLISMSELEGDAATLYSTLVLELFEIWRDKLTDDLGMEPARAFEAFTTLLDTGWLKIISNGDGSYFVGVWDGQKYLTSDPTQSDE